MNAAPDKAQKARYASTQHHDQQNDDQNPLTQRESDDRIHKEVGTATWSIKRPPWVTICSPDLRPSSTSINPSLFRPVRMARYAKSPPSESTHTCARSPSYTTADSGTAGASAAALVRIRKFANISGLSAPSRLSISARTGRRCVTGSTTAAT